MTSTPQATLSLRGPNHWALAGDLTQRSVPDCHQRLVALEVSGDLRIDLQAVARIDSSALALMTNLARRVHARGGRLILKNAPPGFASLASLSGAEGLLGLPSA